MSTVNTDPTPHEKLMGILFPKESNHLDLDNYNITFAIENRESESRRGLPNLPYLEKPKDLFQAIYDNPYLFLITDPEQDECLAIEPSVELFEKYFFNAVKCMGHLQPFFEITDWPTYIDIFLGQESKDLRLKTIAYKFFCRNFGRIGILPEDFAKVYESLYENTAVFLQNDEIKNICEIITLMFETLLKSNNREILQSYIFNAENQVLKYCQIKRNLDPYRALMERLIRMPFLRQPDE